MKKGPIGLRYNGKFAPQRTRFIADRMNDSLKKTARRGAPIEAQLKLLAKLKKQQQTWEKIWKLLIRQAKNNKNKGNIREIRRAAKEAEEHFNKSEELISLQKEVLLNELRKKV
ncbi:MAG: hypothetical protein WC821_02645 [archaeon]|jgi:hypothetical protein